MSWCENSADMGVYFIYHTSWCENSADMGVYFIHTSWCENSVDMGVYFIHTSWCENSLDMGVYLVSHILMWKKGRGGWGFTLFTSQIHITSQTRKPL